MSAGINGRTFSKALFHQPSSLRLICCNNPACRADSRNAGEGGCRASLRVSRAETAGEIDDKSNQQNQANPAAADDRTTKVKPATAEQ